MATLLWLETTTPEATSNTGSPGPRAPMDSSLSCRPWCCPCAWCLILAVLRDLSPGQRYYKTPTPVDVRNPFGGVVLLILSRRLRNQDEAQSSW
ncbi:hypothetical protein Y1Q_0016786 [Alligator mississippiensis]|uniref:Uncharacterized protein n=1 Tax=Alligator mississippiensis TaxID=8496 RepID=A0A151NBB7_ALLMI|nr:hypothetical protein Y1Q_0016786 [Alligator mississippiensis]